MSVGDRSLAPGGVRARKLLALLSVSGNSTVPFDRILEVLWDEPPRSARQQVHNVVGALRRSLAPAMGQVEVVTCDGGYRLTIPEGAVDVARFKAHLLEAERADTAGLAIDAVRSLNGALDEWRGAALSGLPSFYLQNMATLLNEQRLGAVEHLAELQIRLGDSAAAVSYLLGLVAEHPFRESLRALLMRALHESGRQVDALAVYEDGRRRLVEELGLDPGQELQAAQRLILAGNETGQLAMDRRWVDNFPVQETGSQSAPNFLLRDIIEFTGRKDEIGKLLSLAGRADTKALIISAINGMGGVGKTTLVVHLAHKLAEQYPDGQYFVDLLGFSAGAEPMTPYQAVNLLLRRSGIPPELVPSDLDGCSALWRSRTAGRKIMLVLDNASDEAQVRPLLPGSAATLVLISSRRRMPSLEGVVPLSLDVMTQADGLSLFEQIVGSKRTAAEPGVAADAVALCGFLPLAIHVAAARLRDRPGWSIAYLVDHLRDHQSRSRILAAGDRDVMDVLSWSYRHLNSRQQMMFRLLALHPGPEFNIHAAAAVSGLDLVTTATCLEDLFEVSLLQQRSPCRYSFHDLVRDCARDVLRQHADDHERNLATRRIVDFYLRSAAIWCGALGKSPYRLEPDIADEAQVLQLPVTTAEAIELLDAEYKNLSAAVRFAAEIGAHDRVWQLTFSLLPYFRHRNHGVEVEALWEQALQSARADQNLAGESACLTGLAHAKSVLGLNAQARELCITAIGLSQQQNDQVMEIFQRTSYGVMLMNDNQLDDALASFTEALDLASEIGDREAQAHLTNNLGVICRELGRFDQAQRYFRRTLLLDEDTSSPQSQSLTLNNIAEVLFLQGEYNHANATFQDALAMSRSTATQRGEALALIGLCSVRRVQGDYAGSLECGRQGLEISRSSAMYDTEGDALNALGDTRLAAGNVENAGKICDLASELANRFKSARYIARSDELRAHIFSATGDIEAARTNWEQALAVYPGGVVDVAGARRHKVAPEYGKRSCWRCAFME